MPMAGSLILFLKSPANSTTSSVTPKMIWMLLSARRLKEERRVQLLTMIHRTKSMKLMRGMRLMMTTYSNLQRSDKAMSESRSTTRLEITSRRENEEGV
jgi:hypothetical protein